MRRLGSRRGYAARARAHVRRHGLPGAHAARGRQRKHPFPYISNLSLSLAVELEESSREGVELHFARVKIPPTLPRFVPVEGTPAGERRFVLLEDLISHHLDGLFPGLHVRDSYLFRVTRDADLDLQEDEADDLLRAIESELRKRRFGEPVRLEVERGMPEYMRDFLCSSLDLRSRWIATRSRD